MLNRMAHFVGSNRRGRHRAPVINFLTQIHRPLGWIVVVGQLPTRRDDLDIFDIVFRKHALGNFLTGQAGRQGRCSVQLKATFETSTDQPRG